MIRSILIGTATLAAAASVPQLPAMAQEPEASIVVQAPAMRSSDRSTRGVHPRFELVARVEVPTHDLNLRTEWGRDQLERRISLAAQAACDRLDYIEPPTGVGAALNPDSGDCRHLAAKNAAPQVRTAIALAG